MAFEISNHVMAWAVLGLVLIIAEMFTTSFFILFFGISALIVALLSFFGLDSRPIEILVFSILALAGVFLFRKKIVASLQSGRDKEVVPDTEKKILLSTDVSARGYAQVMYQGTAWTAYNETEVPMKSGEEVLISRVEGVKIILRKL